MKALHPTHAAVSLPATGFFTHWIAALRARLHRPPPDDAATRFPRTTFVGGVEEAVATAKEIAGDLDVTIASPDIIQQALKLGLVDDVCITLVPALFGEGIPYFAALAQGHVLLDDPEVVQGRRALHLRYPVRR